MRRGDGEKGRGGEILKVLASLVLFLLSNTGIAQVKVRLFADRKPESVIFSVLHGRYEMITASGTKISLNQGEPVMISKYNGSLAFKARSHAGFISDSVMLSGCGDGCLFSLTIDGERFHGRSWSGDVSFGPDLGTIVIVNTCPIEDYIAGVTQAEGGNGRHSEYFRTQAVIARTYMYSHMDRHAGDGYNLCDNTHCQVYFGIASVQAIKKAVAETHGLVILDRSRKLIMPAFHSNCGGETSPAEFVWLSPAPYLRKVMDPYCSGSANSSWQKTIPGDQWIRIIRESDHQGRTVSIGEAGFVQKSRVAEYHAGKASVPFSELREALGLRSSFFSVYPQGNNVVLKGRGYGHGVGLCQQGAMVMASKGFDFRQIIDFYYAGVTIRDIADAVSAVIDSVGPMTGN
jgi:stage II sporulation protein D